MLTLPPMKQELTPKELSGFQNQLRRNGLKATAQRIAVHEAMVNLGHACADSVHEWIKENSSTEVTVASVYNILTQMTRIGIYNNRMSADNKMYFDVTTFPHLHMYDCERHRYRDIIDEKLYEDILDRIGERRFRGYTIEALDIQFIVRPTRRRP